MQTELRILNGLHRGGILPLDETTLLIGAHEDADVVLVDPGICEHHASLQKTDAGWMLTADAGSVFNAEQSSPQMLLDLLPGDFFRLGETWLVISDSAAAWQGVPHIVAQSLAEDDVFGDADAEDAVSDVHAMNEPVLVGEMTSALAGVSANASAGVSANASADASAAEHAGEAAADSTTVPTLPNGEPEATGAHSASTALRRFKLPRWRKWMIAPATLFALLSAVAAYAYTTKPSLPKLMHPEMPLAWQTEKSSSATSASDKLNAPLRLDTSTGGTSPIASSTATATSSATATSALASTEAARPSPQALQAAFRKRMKDADLLQRFDFDLTDSAWSMRAHLDDEEGARFERILKAFVVEHKITFPISAKVGSAESMLPFQIRQIVTGNNAGIVTGDGDRVYVGDELLGVKLVAVVDNHLTFMGKRKIEVIW